jgi:hypothetical protein
MTSERRAMAVVAEVAQRTGIGGIALQFSTAYSNRIIKARKQQQVAQSQVSCRQQWAPPIKAREPAQDLSPKRRARKRELPHARNGLTRN